MEKVVEFSNSFIVDCAKAIEFMQSLNIVHRDLKFDNIMLKVLPNDTYIFKLVDFNKAKQ